jgi:hypothetical protein
MAFTALPNGRSTRHSHAPSHSDRRSGSAHVRQGTARPAANVDRAAAARGTADHEQAEYYVRLLSQSRALIDRRIDKYQRQAAISQADGDVENVRALRRMTVIEEKDRQVLSEMIDNLEQRFRLRASGGVPTSLGGRGPRPIGS